MRETVIARPGAAAARTPTSKARLWNATWLRRSAALALLLSIGTPATPRTGDTAAAKALRLVMVDVEGGAATLLVTPQGKSVLIDTGWPTGFRGADPARSSSIRIAAAAKALGVSKIDYLIITHYHMDHVGGVQDLLAQMPVGTVIDHGPNREMPKPGATPGPNDTASLYVGYQAAIASHQHRIVKPGDRIAIGPLVLDVVSADRAVLTRALRGTGQSTPGCDGPRLPDLGNGGEENPRAIGIVAHYGAARIVSLADLTADVEWGLICPTNRIGRADLLIVSHHGSQLSTNPQLLAALAPRVALMGNGATKGGDERVLQTIAAAPSHPVLWQEHLAVKSPAANRPAAYIANLTADPDEGYSLSASVWPDRRVQVTNGRTGYSEDYPAPR
jgi:beta-lactamase superfamily II metal-dependent hydrolase